MTGATPGGAPPAPRPGDEAGARAGDTYCSLTFLIDDAGRVHPLPHDTYVALAAGVAAPGFAGGRYRLADWHVRSRDGVPAEVVAEWYGWVAFDGDGRFEPAPQAARGPRTAASTRPRCPTPTSWRACMRWCSAPRVAGAAGPAEAAVMRRRRGRREAAVAGASYATSGSRAGRFCLQWLARCVTTGGTCFGCCIAAGSSTRVA